MSLNLHETVILTALACEAKPLIHHFGLKRQQHVYAFPLYRNNDKKITLIISGIGMIYAAAATSFVAAYIKYESMCFLNIGIAGAFNLGLGDIRLINKISNEEEHSFYPMALNNFNSELLDNSAALKTVTKPTLAAPDYLVDMESFAFYQIATRFTTLELIHTLKIISDNKDQSFQKVDSHQVITWIETHIETIDIFLTKLNMIASNSYQSPTQETDLLKTLSKKFHITQYQFFQIKKMLPKIFKFELSEEEMRLREKCRSIKQWLEGMQILLHEYSWKRIMQEV